MNKHKAYQPIIGTLGYVLSPDRNSVLMIHRNRKAKDDHYGKYNGLGGKMEPDEDIFSSMKREILEEAGIRVTSMHFRGTINWRGFGAHHEDWLGHLFLIDGFEGKPLTHCHEGDLEWVPLDCLEKLPMWEGDQLFLPLLFDDDPRPFHAYMPYKEGVLLSFSYQR